MSADSWRICPKCSDKVDDEYTRLEIKINEGYGKIPQREYLALISRRDEIEDTDNEDLIGTKLREDYEVYTDADGFFTVKYRCECLDCGFEFEFKHQEQLEWSKE